MSRHLTPVQVCERLIGPVETLGPIAGLQAKAAYGWRRESQYRDAGDLTPRANRALLAHAAAHDIPLTADHLIWGAPEEEIEQLLAAMPQKPADRARSGNMPVAAE
ncbi:hypothetical protein P775_08320 [Puniceibacterium antarcticum]|uniref:Uncharacterized protein n=1 Tax=Puniceibacterium antarcticum TaxID=1206336 RepID=A0A2G8RG18_9RHOB|nr:hypothetical protein [Puniceibacterium antarcticum]PIL20524.1 hypothetical protein P775_08320 [Puniceibacterium antarcticum]